MIRLSKPHARRFLIARHSLGPPRSLRTIHDVVSRLGSLQVDPLAVTGLRNHELVLAARLAAYAPTMLERALYIERSLVEVYDKSLCIVSIDDLPFHAAEWRRAARAIKERGGAYHESSKRFASAILRKLDRDGPQPTRDLSRAGKKVYAGWGQTTEARAALHVLVRTGKVLTVRRENNVRFYDRIERVIPKSLLEMRIDHASSIRHRVLGRFRAMGLLGLSPSAEVFISTTPAKQRAKVVADLIAEKKLVPVEVEDAGQRFVVASDLELIETTASSVRAKPAAALLAPLDPMIWDRTLLGPLFGFEYRWGVYTPRHARTGGYYDLPIVYGDQIVGMIEPVFDRQTRTLRVVRLAISGRASLRLRHALGVALDAHARAIGARTLVWDARAPSRTRKFDV